MNPPNPKHGGRVVLDLLTEDDSVRYRATLATPDQMFEGVASVRLSDGEVGLAWDGAPPPGWLEKNARAFLRGEWNARKAGGPPWPRRISRWRAEPT